MGQALLSATNTRITLARRAAGRGATRPAELFDVLLHAQDIAIPLGAPLPIPLMPPVPPSNVCGR